MADTNGLPAEVPEGHMRMMVQKGTGDGGEEVIVIETMTNPAVRLVMPVEAARQLIQTLRKAVGVTLVLPDGTL